MSLKNSALIAGSAIFTLALYSSCVNDDYDLTKDFDKTVTIDGDIKMPVGNSETILISDILDLDESQSGVLTIGENGDYSLNISGDRTETTFNVPTISITRALTTEGGFIGSIDRSDILGELGIVSTTMPLPSGLTMDRDFPASKTPVVIDETVPEEIIDIKEISGTATGIISLHTNIAKATVSGLAISFPEYLNIGSVSTADKEVRFSFDRKNNTLTFEPTTVTGTAIVIRMEIIGIDFDRLPAGQGFIADRHAISLNDDIKISGFTLRMLSDDFGKTVSDIPEKVTMDLGITIGSVDMADATIKVDPKIDIQPMWVNVGTLPSFVNGDGTVLDLYNPQVMLQVSNGSPLALTLNAVLESDKAGDKARVRIGNGSGATDEIRIKADGETMICLSRTGEDTPENFTSVTVPDLTDLIKNVPDRIGITDTDIKATDEYITVKAGKDYRLSYSYNVLVPLAFGSEMRFGYSTDFSGWNETFNNEDGDDFEIRNADLTFDFVNTIPVGFGLSASAIDKSGNVIPEIKMTVDGDAAPGSISKPGRSSVRLNIKAESNSLNRLDGIRLNLNASGPGKDHQGECLNKNQGIRLENMKLSMQGSITTEL